MIVFEISTPRIADAGQNFRHAGISCSSPLRLRHDQQAGLDGREAKADLVKQRQEKRHAADAEPGEEAAADRGAEGANAEQTQMQERKCDRVACSP